MYDWDSHSCFACVDSYWFVTNLGKKLRNSMKLYFLQGFLQKNIVKTLNFFIHIFDLQISNFFLLILMFEAKLNKKPHNEGQAGVIYYSLNLQKIGWNIKIGEFLCSWLEHQIQKMFYLLRRILLVTCILKAWLLNGTNYVVDDWIWNEHLAMCPSISVYADIMWNIGVNDLAQSKLLQHHKIRVRFIGHLNMNKDIFEQM